MAAPTPKDIEDIKNDIHDKDEYKKNLKMQAASDAKHDLGDAFTSIYRERDGIARIGTPHNEFEATKTSGWDVVHTIIENRKDGTKIDIPNDTKPPKANIDIMKNDIDPIIIKFSGYEYKLTTININDKTTATTLFNFMKDDEDQTELCLILDATMGPFQKILAKMNAADVEINKKYIYIIVNRETISDPAGKPNEKDPDFKDARNKKREVEVHIALDSSPESVVYPKWIDPRENYRSDFFSDFNLELKAVKYGVTKSVLLTFSGKDYTNESVIETSASGKLANSKNAMAKMLRRIQENLEYLRAIITRGDARAGTQQNHNDLRDYFVSLQKKRSGDTLIALSFFDTSRTYNSNKQTFTFNEKPRYVLTHDTFNTLPISLINGADVIYTGPDNTIYKFRRAREKTDFTEVFFNSFIKTKKERDDMFTFLNDQMEKYLEMKEKIIDEITTAIEKVEVDSKREGKSTATETPKKFTMTEIRELKDKINTCLQLFFKLALFRSLYSIQMNIPAFENEVKELVKVAYDPTNLTLKNRIDKVKEIYYTQRVKNIEYTRNFPEFKLSFIKNIVYQEIRLFDVIISSAQPINFGNKINKFTFGASPVIHNYLFKTDGTERFIKVLSDIYKSPYISGDRLAKNKEPMREVLSAFINLTPLDPEADSSVVTSDLLDAAHGEIGIVTATNATDQPQAVASVSCVMPYHEGIRGRVVATAKSLITAIKGMFDTDKTSGGVRIEEKKILELSSFILLNYMVEMNVYCKGEYSDPNLDVYGQVIPMAGKLLLHAMNFSRDPMSQILFFMRMSYFANDKASFEREYGETLKGNKSLYFLPCIFENVISNAFGPEFLEDFQEFSLTYIPKVLRNQRVKSLLPPIPEMSNPKWEIVENDIKIKVRKITENIDELSSIVGIETAVSPGKRLRNWEAYNREEIAAMGGRYKKTRKSSKRTTKAKSRRHKK
jgi:hypothetical protein